MRYLIILVLLAVAQHSFSATPEQILKNNGFKLVTQEKNRNTYYRPREVVKDGPIVFYSTTTFYTNGNQKYSLRSEYKVMACKEKVVLLRGIHDVPFIGMPKVTDLTKKKIKDSDFKPLSALDKKMHSRLCK